MDLGPEARGYFAGAIRGPGVHHNNVVHQIARGIQAVRQVVLFVLHNQAQGNPWPRRLRSDRDQRGRLGGRFGGRGRQVVAGAALGSPFVLEALEVGLELLAAT